MSSPSFSLQNPLLVRKAQAPPSESASENIYDRALLLERELHQLPLDGGGTSRVRTQHAKGRMTVWERIRVLTDQEPNILWRNWGPGLDGASIVTGILDVGGRDVAVYGHDFTLRAGSMDATLSLIHI